MSDLIQLVNGSRGGDVSAFHVFVFRFQNMVVVYAYAQLGDFHLAEDAAQFRHRRV